MRLAAEFLQTMNELLLLSRKAASTPLEHLSRVIWFTIVPVQHGLVILEFDVELLSAGRIAGLLISAGQQQFVKRIGQVGLLQLFDCFGVFARFELQVAGQIMV